jgi:hypothetical protein
LACVTLKITPYPDKPEKRPQNHKDTRQNALAYLPLCPGGKDILPQNAKISNGHKVEKGDSR